MGLNEMATERFIIGKQNNPGKLTDGKHAGRISEVRRKLLADDSLQQLEDVMFDLDISEQMVKHLGDSPLKEFHQGRLDYWRRVLNREE